MPIPIVHAEDPPEGELAGVFRSKPATEWDEVLGVYAAIDLERARKMTHDFLEAFRVMRSFPVMP